MCRQSKDGSWRVQGETSAKQRGRNLSRRRKYAGGTDHQYFMTAVRPALHADGGLGDAELCRDELDQPGIGAALDGRRGDLYLQTITMDTDDGVAGCTRMNVAVEPQRVVEPTKVRARTVHGDLRRHWEPWYGSDASANDI